MCYLSVIVLRFVDFEILALNGTKFIAIRFLYLEISVQKTAVVAKHNIDQTHCFRVRQCFKESDYYLCA